MFYRIQLREREEEDEGKDEHERMEHLIKRVFAFIVFFFLDFLNT